jgi:hypothetical protein
MPRVGKKARLNAAGASTARAPAPRSQEHDASPTSLYGLYSTNFEDFCSGASVEGDDSRALFSSHSSVSSPCVILVFSPFLLSSWFPCSYVGPAPALSSDAASSADTPASSLASDAVLVRWHSDNQKYEPERLSMAFLRSGAEFALLPVSHQHTGKKVLVRDLLQDMDFAGVSFWLATIQSEPVLPPPPVPGKKRSSQVPMVSVAYQNSMSVERAGSGMYRFPFFSSQL